MNRKLILLSLAGTALLAGFAWATQVVFPNTDNVLANRLPGTWMLDTELTRKLDPDRSATDIMKLEFADDLKVLAHMQRYVSDRFKNHKIFGAGWLWIDDATEKLPYIVTQMNGNPHVIWFEPSGKTAFADPVVKNVWIAIGRDRSKDVMFFGGDTIREASAAFCREALVTRTGRR